MKTWESGDGVTFDGGTGANYKAFAGYKLGLLNYNILILLPGGDLKFKVYEKIMKLSFMEGPAKLFNGEIQ